MQALSSAVTRYRKASGSSHLPGGVGSGPATCGPPDWHPTRLRGTSWTGPGPDCLQGMVRGNCVPPSGPPAPPQPGLAALRGTHDPHGHDPIGDTRSHGQHHGQFRLALFEVREHHPVGIRMPARMVASRQGSGGSYCRVRRIRWLSLPTLTTGLRSSPALDQGSRRNGHE